VVEVPFDAAVDFLVAEFVSAGRGFTGAGTGADSDDNFGVGTDIFDFFFLTGGGDGAFDEGDVEVAEFVFSFEGVDMAEFDEFFPGV